MADPLVILQRAVLRLNSRAPFYAAALLQVPPRIVERTQSGHRVEGAVTDGRFFYLNPRMLSSCPDDELETTLAALLLHAMSVHPLRGRGREPARWQLACDLTIHLPLKDHGFVIPSDWPLDEMYRGLSAEQVYDALHGQPLGEQPEQRQDVTGLPPQTPRQGEEQGEDSREELDGERENTGKTCPLPTDGRKNDQNQPDEQTPDVGGPANSKSGTPSLAESWDDPDGWTRLEAEIQRQSASEARDITQAEDFWEQVTAAANISGLLAGDAPGNLPLTFMPTRTRNTWRQTLRRYLTPTLNDYAGLERRLIPCGFYSQALGGEVFEADIGIDTSGSVSDAAVFRLVAEVQDALRLHPQMNVRLFYFDTRLYGPHVLKPGSSVPPIQGRGGTDFTPFFKASERATLRLIFTDGRANFPAAPRQGSTLWVYTPGTTAHAPPFGHLIRLERPR